MLKTTIAKVVFRVIGTLNGLFALLTLGVLLLPAILSPTEWVILLPVLVVVLPLNVWFLYVAWLVWAEFSPRVVRQVCGVVALQCFLHILHPMRVDRPLDPHATWAIAAFVGLIIATWAVYKVVSKQLNHWLFPEFG